ncbi:MAG: family 10 glycosylhydrolase [Limnochordales bacterium]|nr:family 10 glycosylhydrolase [Limnochordales bacterium]
MLRRREMTSGLGRGRPPKGRPGRLPTVLLVLMLGFVSVSGAALQAQESASLQLVSPRLLVGDPGETDAEWTEELPITWVNRPLRLGQQGIGVFLPDPFLPATTLTPASSIDIIVRQGVVERISIEGNTPIPADGYVLSVPQSMVLSVMSAGVKVRKAVDLDLYHLERTEASVTHRINGFNRSRGTDELIIYRPAPGRTRTLTNQWGIEAVVVDGRIVSVGGNNQAIPSNGFVISGHGQSADWIRENVQVGQRVEIRSGQGQSAGDTLVLTVDAETYLIRAEKRLAQLEQSLAAAAASWADIAYTPARQALDQGKELLARARAQWEELKARAGTRAAKADQPGAEGEGSLEEATGMVIRTALQAQAEADRGLLLAYPSATVSLRGAWYRPSETSPEEIAATLDRFQAAGFNVLFLESFYHGQTLWPSAIGKQRSEYIGWDPMAVWVEEAHKRGIELHAWVHVFNVGERGASDPGAVLNAHPEWALRRPDGSVVSALEPGLAYVDPGNPQVRKFLSDLFAELISKYDIDGFEYDYIRYPAGAGNNAAAIIMGDAEREIFQTETGIDPATLRPGSNTADWRRWCDWRMAQVTRFVAETSARFKAIRPDIKLSAAVVGDPAEARASKLQDWPTWLAAGYLDFISAMAYTEYDLEYVKRQAEGMARLAGPKAFAATGISIMEGALAMALPQTMTVLASDNPGVVHFAFNYADGGMLRELKAGPFRLPAVPPYDVARAALALANRIAQRLGPEPCDCPSEAKAQARAEAAGTDLLDPLYRAGRSHSEAAARVREALDNLAQAAALAQASASAPAGDRADQANQANQASLAALQEAVQELRAALADLASADGVTGEWLLGQVDDLAAAIQRATI